VLADQAKPSPEGIVLRHRRRCASQSGSRCSCRPGFQAQVYSPAERRTIRKTFRSLSDARTWRAQAMVTVGQGGLRSPTRITLAEASEGWLEAAESGVIRTRSGDRYKPSALRAYRQAIESKLVPALGGLRLSALTRPVIQDFVDRLVGQGLSPSTVRNTILPLRAIFRRAVARMEVAENPTKGLTLPAVRGRRDRIARPQEAAALIEALELADRAIYATALYAGLRRGELRGLRWKDVDFERSLIRVERAWDDRAGEIEPKSRAGRRRVPLAGPLRSVLAEHRLSRAPHRDDLIFTGQAGRPFCSGWVAERVAKVWQENELQPIGLHECRHNYAAFMIAAGVNAKALSTYMGHSSITITLDRYGHLMPGNEREAADLLTGYLARAAYTTRTSASV